mgnify:CR=1 FL=1
MENNRKLVVFALMIATFLAAIEGTIVSAATAAIANDLKGVSLVNWIFTIYLLLMAVTTPIFGKLSDLYGRRSIFTLGSIIFLLGASLCGFAQTMKQLIWFRALQGLGAGAVIPMTTTIAGDLYPYEERAKILGLFSGIWAISGVIGPLLGGVLVDQLSWHWIFLINLPFGILSLILLWIFYKENVNKNKKKQIDYQGTFTFAVSITAFLLMILMGGTYIPWFSLTMLILFVVAIVFFLLFLYIETKAPDPMLPLSLFKIPSILYANLAAILLSIILIGLNIYPPIWMQGILGYGAIGAVLTSAPLSIGWVIGSNTVSWILLKLKPRITTFIGFMFLLLGTFGLTMLTQTSATWVICLMMFILGIGFGISMTVVVVLGQSGIQKNLRGIATATNVFVRTLGQAVGAAIYGAIFNYICLQQSMAKSIQSTSEIEQILRPETSKMLSAEVISTLRDILFQSLHVLFWVMCLFALCSILIGWKIPNQQPEE